MHSLQQVELKMLQMVDDICRELHIKYYLVCGSALGAVKYSGFIPWDDDLDIGLLRPDYEIFVREAKRLLPDNYFLQITALIQPFRRCSVKSEIRGRHLSKKARQGWRYTMVCT